MKTTVSIYWVLTCVWMCGGAFAEELKSPTPASAPQGNPVTSWQGVIRVALASNVNYAALLQEARAEYFKVRAKADWQNPQLLLNTSLPNSHLFSQADEGRQYGSRLRFYIPNPFLNAHLRAEALATRRSLEAQARMERSEAALVVYQLCSELQMAEALLKIHERRTENLKAREQFVRERVANRLSPEAELQALHIQGLRTEMTIAQVKQSIQTARRTLSILARLPSETISLPPLSRDLAVQASGMARRKQVVAMAPEYQAAAEANQMASAAHKVAKAGNLPWFDYVDAGYSFRDTQDEGQWQLRVAFILPFFSTTLENAAHAARAAAQLREADVERQLRMRYDVLQQELRDAWTAVDVLPAIPVPKRDDTIDPLLYFKMCDDCVALEEQQLEFLYRPLVVCGELFQVLNAWESIKD